MAETEKEKRIQWWTEDRYGMFIHWGIHAQIKRGMCVLEWERIPNSEYKKFADTLDPVNLDTDEWISQAKQSGMKYIYLTTKHADGFCLWDSKVTDFTSAKTGAKRDVVAEFTESCRKAGIRVGIYYAVYDVQKHDLWSQSPETSPAGWEAYEEYVSEQLRELMGNYGKVDVLWYDGVPVSHDGKGWGSEKLYSIPRSLQPDIIINDRVYGHGDNGDFTCGECNISASSKLPWESCYTIPDVSWGYNPGDPNLKSSMELVRLMVRCVSQGGNFTLNVSPMADGRITPPHVARMKDIGDWMSRNAESIYGAGEVPFYVYLPGHMTLKGNTVYVHVMYWPGSEICLAGFKNRINRVRMLATGEDVNYEQRKDRLFLRGLPENSPDPMDTVFALEMEGKPEGEVEEWWMIDRWWMRE